MATSIPRLSCCFLSPGAAVRRERTTTTLARSDRRPPPPSISSTSNPFVKHCLKLRLSSSYRRSCGSVLVVGLTPIVEISRFQELKDGRLSMIDCLLLLDGAEIPKELCDSSTSIVHVSSIVLKKLSGMQSIDSVEAIAVMKIPRSFSDMDSKEASFQQIWTTSPYRLLALDGIQDPGNLGTLLRSAMAFKWDGIFLLPGCCDPFNEKALRAARGASFQLPIVSGNWFDLEGLSTKFEMKMLAGHPETQCDPISLSREFADSLAGSECRGPCGSGPPRFRCDAPTVATMVTT